MRLRRASAVFALLVCAGSSFQAEAAGVPRWLVTVADGANSEPRTWRFYKPISTLSLWLTLNNESEQTVLVDQSALQDSVLAMLRPNQRLSLTWHSAEIYSPERGTRLRMGLSEILALPPGEQGIWSVELDPVQGPPFATGSNVVDVDLRTTRAALSSFSEASWTGGLYAPLFDLTIVARRAEGP